jgi:hypothetical protein
MAVTLNTIACSCDVQAVHDNQSLAGRIASQSVRMLHAAFGPCLLDRASSGY